MNPACFGDLKVWSSWLFSSKARKNMLIKSDNHPLFVYILFSIYLRWCNMNGTDPGSLAPAWGDWTSAPAMADVRPLNGKPFFSILASILRKVDFPVI